jgi:hypothetical protein
MKNVIIVGDSFCASFGWPELLAKELNMNLIKFGAGGHSWWPIRIFLTKTLSSAQLTNCDLIIFVHTDPWRVPTLNDDLVRFDHMNPNPTVESELAIKLWYKYIRDTDYLLWATKKWYEEINNEWSKIKTIHVHAFPWSWPIRNLLGGMNISPNLASISLNELDYDDIRLLAADRRPNHMNQYNNQILADQLFNAIKNYQLGDFELDIGKFQLLSNKWFDWK